MSAAELERIVAEHRMLRESVEANPMPYAVYDAEDRLIAYNKAYEATHAEAFRRLRHLVDAHQLRYADLIRVTAEATLPPEEVEAHIAERVRRQREADGAAVDREYPGLGWLRVCKFATPSGAIAGFALDINELKQREAALEAQIARSSELERKLRELADTDVLTGVASRRAFLARAAEEFQRARRYGGGLCVTMLDVDEFKAVNDRHGHAVGDGVLVRVAQACMAQMRGGADLCGRLGGEEFAVLMPQTGAEGAVAFAERMRAAIASQAFGAAGAAFRVTSSFGVAAIATEDADFSALLSRADTALYSAKSGGRNCVRLG
jgi:diguanylate cyclase (GGDEF)-like protein